MSLDAPSTRDGLLNGSGIKPCGHATLTRRSGHLKRARVFGYARARAVERRGGNSFSRSAHFPMRPATPLNLNLRRICRHPNHRTEFGGVGRAARAAVGAPGARGNERGISGRNSAHPHVRFRGSEWDLRVKLQPDAGGYRKQKLVFRSSVRGRRAPFNDRAYDDELQDAVAADRPYPVCLSDPGLVL
jgi:hypothetical protein